MDPRHFKDAVCVNRVLLLIERFCASKIYEILATRHTTVKIFVVGRYKRKEADFN
jgi:hypothetical protein